MTKVTGLEGLIKAVDSKYGQGTLMRASNATGLVVDRLPSGIFELDLRNGGGWPRGRISMLKGDFSTCKTAICMKTVAQAQRRCRHCNTPIEIVSLLGEVNECGCTCGENEPMRPVWLDAEHSFDPSWAQKWGIQIDNLLVIETEYMEQAIDVANECIWSKEADLLIVDSVAAFTPGVEVQESSESWQVGVAARLMNKALRKWTSGLNSYGMIAKTKCTILLINQYRVGIGGYRATITSPGGKGLDFFESIEDRFSKKEFIEEAGSKRPVGIRIEFVVKKNKTAPPGMPGGGFTLYFVPQKGSYAIGDSDLDVQVLNSAVFWKLIERGGAWYTFPNGERVQGKSQAARLIWDNPELLDALIKDIEDRELSWRTTGSAECMVEEEDDE